jgi:hypothetical protein
MPISFVLTYWLVGLALIVALTSVPLAARGAPRSYWWGQFAISLALALTLAGILYVGVYDRAIALWRCVVGDLVAIVLPTLGAGWSARGAVRLWPQSRRVGAVLGTIIGLGLIAAICAVVTSRLIPDVITSTS